MALELQVCQEWPLTYASRVTYLARFTCEGLIYARRKTLNLSYVKENGKIP